MCVGSSNLRTCVSFLLWFGGLPLSLLFATSRAEALPSWLRRLWIKESSLSIQKTKLRGPHPLLKHRLRVLSFGSGTAPLDVVVVLLAPTAVFWRAIFGAFCFMVS